MGWLIGNAREIGALPQHRVVHRQHPHDADSTARTGPNSEVSAQMGGHRAGSGTIVGSEEPMHTTSLTPSTPSAVWRPGAEALVDLGAIAHNVRVLREHAGSAGVMAVVKADAYGHGAPQVARAAVAAGAAELGVATVDEALTLRAAGDHRPGAGVAAPARHRLAPR